VQALVEQKIAGEEVAETPEAGAPRAQVIDLMDALKESLARGRAAKGRAAAAGKSERAAKAGARRPTAAARSAAEPEAPPKRARKK
jgi:non-homologous end joining protein Ku